MKTSVRSRTANLLRGRGLSSLARRTCNRRATGRVLGNPRPTEPPRTTRNVRCASREKHSLKNTGYCAVRRNSVRGGMTTSKHGEDGVVPLPSTVHALSTTHSIQVMGIGMFRIVFSRWSAKKSYGNSVSRCMYYPFKKSTGKKMDSRMSSNFSCVLSFISSFYHISS